MSDVTKNIEKAIDSGSIASIPVEAIAEARNALADEYLTLRSALDKPSLITRLHRQRTEARAVKIEQYLFQLDEWLEEVKK